MAWVLYSIKMDADTTGCYEDSLSRMRALGGEDLVSVAEIILDKVCKSI